MKEKILHIYPTLRFRGGAEKLVGQLAEAFNKEYDIVVVSDDEFIGIQGVVHHNVALFDGGIIGSIKGFIQLFKVLKKEQPCIVHSHHRKTTLWTVLLRPFVKIKIIHTHHVILENRWWWGLFKADIYVGVANHVARNLSGYFRIPPSKIIVIPNGVIVPANQIGDCQADKNTAVMISRLEDGKGHDYLIKAWRKVADVVPGAKLVMLGDGSLLNSLKEQAKKLGLENNIVFVGFQPEVYKWICKAEFVIMPSLSEGLPLSVLEAFAAGRAVIASDIEGNLEIVEHGISGLVFPVGNENELAHCVLKLFADKAFSQQLGSNANKVFVKNFAFDKMIGGYSSLYQSIFQKKKFVS